ncbi:MAG: hypothetical protein KGO96_08250 [Elusimicrobia bacterium]|nr:hypothetical protein [Elusimicrobiota bacterium]MDE2237999.1 hypothetical protein [Elusimicrobiota bacterium]MDE2425880.1 hypothetical protein [Elusimicrobiota bacterium]
MPAISEEPSEASGGAGGQGLWAALLVLDAFLLVAFGGTLAMKVYEHWQQPQQTTFDPGPFVHHHRRAARPATKLVAAALPKPAAAAPKPAAAAPRPAEAATAAAVSKAAPKGGATGRPKALPTRFSFKSAHARSVELAGAFIVHGGKKALVRHRGGVWTLTLYLTPNTYRYWFLVNGEKRLDPHNSKKARGASVITVAR